MATLTDAQIAGLARSAGFPDSEIPRAVAIALAESGGRTDVIGHNTNGTVDVGLWQINSVHGHSTASMQDPVQNAQAAHQIWAAAGNRWTPWVTFNRGSYLAFMGRGNAAAGHPDNSAALSKIQNGGSSAASGFPGADTSASAGIDTSGASAIFAQITSGALWLRVGAFGLGVILLIMGAIRLMGTNQTVIEFTKGAAQKALEAAPLLAE